MFLTGTRLPETSMTAGFRRIPTTTPHRSPPPSTTTPPPRLNPTTTISAVASTTTEIRVCTNRTCRRQGSPEVLHVLSAIAPPTVSVASCGCLGRCGAGPNLVVLPSQTVVNHCATAARAADVMAIVCGFDSVGCEKSLEALSLRKKAEGEMENGDFVMAEILLSQQSADVTKQTVFLIQTAEVWSTSSPTDVCRCGLQTADVLPLQKQTAPMSSCLLSKAIDLNPVGGVHFIYKARSVARLALNKITAALEDAVEASTLAPAYPEAYICKGDALMALQQYEAAGDCYSMALELDPSIRRSKSFKARVAKLQEKLATTNC